MGLVMDILIIQHALSNNVSKLLLVITRIKNVRTFIMAALHREMDAFINQQLPVMLFLTRLHVINHHSVNGSHIAKIGHRIVGGCHKNQVFVPMLLLMRLNVYMIKHADQFSVLIYLLIIINIACAIKNWRIVQLRGKDVLKYLIVINIMMLIHVSIQNL